MTKLLENIPCVLFALAREASAFYRHFKPRQHFPAAPCRARLCGPALVLESGVGARATERALNWLPFRPKLVLSAGYCGALQDQFRVGDIVLASEVVDTSGGRWSVTWPAASQNGRLLTIPALATDPNQKRRLGLEHEANVVDMETARTARWCSERDIPFASVRAVSDDIQTALSPRLVALLSGGRVSPPRLLMSVARQPRLVSELWRLAWGTRLASERLAVALKELLTSVGCTTR
jgi:hypothetical protein